MGIPAAVFFVSQLWRAPSDFAPAHFGRRLPCGERVRTRNFRSAWLVSIRSRGCRKPKMKCNCAADNKDHLHSIPHTINDSGPKSAEVRTSPPKSETLCSTGTFAKFPNFPGRPQTPRNGLRRPGGQGVVGSNPTSSAKFSPLWWASRLSKLGA